MHAGLNYWNPDILRYLWPLQDDTRSQCGNLRIFLSLTQILREIDFWQICAHFQEWNSPKSKSSAFETVRMVGFDAPKVLMAKFVFTENLSFRKILRFLHCVDEDTQCENYAKLLSHYFDQKIAWNQRFH